MNDLIRWVQKNETAATGYGFALFVVISAFIFRHDIGAFFAGLF